MASQCRAEGQHRSGVRQNDARLANPKAVLVFGLSLII